MEAKSLIEKINSKYIIKNIISFIKDENILKKLYFYSKSLQETINISLFDYKEDYFNKRMQLNKYLCYNKGYDKSDFEANNHKKYFKEQLIENNFKDDEVVHKIIVNYFRKLN